MADTVREKIMDNIKATIVAITTGAGFENTISNVFRWHQFRNFLKTVPAVVIEEGPEDLEDNAYPITTCKLTVFCTLWIRQEESDTTDTGQLLNSLLGDIKKALKADITRGGFAEDTLIRSVTPFETDEGQPYAGLIIESMVHYRHLQTDPQTGA